HRPAPAARGTPGAPPPAAPGAPANAGGQVPDPVPDAVRIVTSRVAARALSGRDDGAASVAEQADIFQRTVTLNADAANGGVYLTKADRMQLRRWSARGSVFSVDISGTGRG
ncbi:hypothetical protein ACM0CA_22650, partial [Mycobacteroides abscessus subsp. abscessus]|uniref:hypothetical protein n=1 Tax=Mycobacteroides abscessus TaxID=36809 RepID=UPI0039F109B5